jgi:hypothetical protein
MSRTLNLSPRHKAKIDRLYLKGFKPSEICAELPALRLSPRQVTRYLYRRGLTKQRTAIEAGKQQTALEILRRVRAEGQEDFEELIREIAAGLKIDATKLRDGWGLVQDAAGASSLMRAKGLLLDRTLRTYGADGTEQETPKQSGIELFYIEAPIGRVEKQVASEPESET